MPRLIATLNDLSIESLEIDGGESPVGLDFEGS